MKIQIIKRGDLFFNEFTNKSINRKIGWAEIGFIKSESDR